MHIMLFDLQISGHHPAYIRHLLHYWPDPNTTLTLVVSPEFLQKHDDVVQIKSEATVIWLPITTDELNWYRGNRGMLLRLVRVEWKIFYRYAKKTKADHGLVMHIDHFQLPLALHLSLPCPISGIYFRPKFHYTNFESHQPAKGERLKAIREQSLLRSALHHHRLKTIFCLDPLAVDPLNLLSSQNKAVHLPDPVEFHPPAKEKITKLRTRLGVEAHRKIFLLFGAIDQRKGIYEALSAMEQLAKPEQQSIALLLVGQVSKDEKDRLRHAIRKTESLSVAQIILHDEYIAEEDIPIYFSMADVVLALYQQHVGSSGVLLWAAAAGKPVLASDYGLMGKLVCQHSLGYAIDSTKAHSIGLGINACLNAESFNGFDCESATIFAKSNSASSFAQTIGQMILGST